MKKEKKERKLELIELTSEHVHLPLTCDLGYSHSTRHVDTDHSLCIYIVCQFRQNDVICRSTLKLFSFKQEMIPPMTFNPDCVYRL